MIANTRERTFDVVEITNEMPLNRIGGVGTVVESLISGFQATATRALWFLVDHGYRRFELDQILARFPCVVVGTHDDLRRFDAPVAHLHSYNVNPGLVEALGGRTTVFTVHSLLVEEERSNDVDLSGSVRWQEELLAACDAVAVVSEAERTRYRALGYDALNPNVAVVHNGVRTPDVYRAPRERRTLGFSGRLVPRKHPEYVQQILCEPGFESCRTLIAGKAFSRYARDLVGRLRIDDRVRYLGWCGGPRLEAFYDAVDVIVLPSIYEPFGLSALEAAARGVPVVCTRVDGLIEVLGEHAFYADDASYPAFRAAMERWLDADEVCLAAMAAGAHDRYRERFTDVAMARAYIELFAAASASDGGRRSGSRVP
jgi:glycosyltransferase involved in cell wall biosynthesis